MSKRKRGRTAKAQSLTKVRPKAAHSGEHTRGRIRSRRGCLRVAGEDRHGHRGLVCVVGGVEVDQAALSDRPVRSTCKSVHPPQRR
jgi:hypothetical protein